MVTTRAQGASTSRAGGQPLQPEHSGVVPLAPTVLPVLPVPSALPVPVLAPTVPPLQIQALREDALAALAQQFGDLRAEIRELRGQHSAAQPPVQPPPVEVERPRVGHSRNRGFSPLKPHRRSSSRRQRVSKHHRSPSPRSISPLKRRSGKEPEQRSHRRHRHYYSSSGSSREGSYDGQAARRADRRLDDYRQRLEELNRRIPNPPEMDYECRPPLSRRITEEPIPPRFRLPQLDPYDGTADPADHLESYKVLMQVQGATDALLCIAFPATLRKAARAWYSRLPPRSINSFRQLGRSFLAHFDACRKIPRAADSLFTVQQKSGEPLKDFVARFKEAALEVYNLEDSIATLALKRGLRPSRFAYSLDKKPPTSYAELLVRAQKYIRADEADSSRREADKGSSKKTTNQEPAGPRPKKSEPQRRPDQRPRTFIPRENYTPLLAPISHILMEIEGEPYLQRPHPMKPGPRNKELYCRYHRDFGHDTEDCRVLKKAIEDLVQQGHLGKYVRRGNPAIPVPLMPPAAQHGVDNAPTEKTVATISWGASCRQGGMAVIE